MIIHYYALSIIIFVTHAQLPPSHPQNTLPAKELAEPYKEQNKCAFLKPSQGSVPYSFWTCGAPFKQTYCGAETVFEYQCCPGFTKTPLVNNECAEAESVWKLLHEHLKDYSVPKFSDLLMKHAGVPDLFNAKGTGTYTILAPHSDSALKLGDFDLSSTSGSPHPITMHISKNRMYSDQLTNGVSLKTVNGDHKLKVTTYSNGLVFIECRALVSPDHESRNGIIHYISGPITPHTGSGYQRKTVLQAMQSDPATNAFYNDIPSDMRTLLDQETDGVWFTVFAPSNAAWNEAKSKYGEKISTLVKNHILDRMICAQAITKKATSLGPSLAGEFLGVDCNSDLSRAILDACGNQAKIIKEDLVSGNGVVQVIDRVLIPTSVMNAKDAVSCMSKSDPKVQLSNFLDHVKDCDLQMTSSSKYILLVPTNEAHNWIQGYSKYGNQYSQIQSDADYKCQVLRYHVLKMKGDSPNLVNQKSFDTNLENMGKPLTVVTYFVKSRDGSKLFFNSAPTTNLEAKNFNQGKIYFVDRMNIPPSKTMMQLLSEVPDVSVITGKLRDTGFESQLQSYGHNIVFLAWQNHGWQTRKEKEWGSSELQRLFQLHTIKMELWGSDIGYFEPETISTVNAVYMENGAPFPLQIKRELNGNIYIGYDGLPFELWSLVIESNLHGTDGMVWIIDWPLRFKS